MSSRKRDAGLRFDDFAMTLAEVGRELGISRERARQRASSNSLVA